MFDHESCGEVIELFTFLIASVSVNSEAIDNFPVIVFAPLFQAVSFQFIYKRDEYLRVLYGFFGMIRYLPVTKICRWLDIHRFLLSYTSILLGGKKILGVDYYALSNSKKVL
jgi:hypothetical protein